jgi:metal transporter CNNM
MSCVGLVMFAGLMSGLSLVDLEVLAKAGTPKDRLNAGGYISILLLFFSQLLTSSPAWLAQSSDMIWPPPRGRAARILPVVKNQHLLLCTLLIGNSLAMEALPIFLDTLVPSVVAILISVTLILAFGEVGTCPLSFHFILLCVPAARLIASLLSALHAQIMPQAICTRYGLSVVAMATPLVRILLLVFFPVAYPISKVIFCSSCF